MAGRARTPKNKVSGGNPRTPVTPRIGGAGDVAKDATKRDPRALGAALRLYRGDRSRAKVAAAAGIKPSQLSDYEKGKTVPRPATLGKIAETLDVTDLEICALADLLGLAPELLDRTAEPGFIRALEKVVRWATRLRSAEATLTPSVLSPGSPHREPADAEADRQAAVLWERLRPYSASQRRAIVQEGEEFQVWALSTRLCDESIEAAADDPTEALELAQLAELIASLVAGPDAWRLRLQGYCAFHVSSTHRACGDLTKADETLDRAEKSWDASAGGDPEGRLAEARVLGLKASLRREQRYLEEALDLLDEALASDRGDLQAHLLINRAKTLEEMGRYKEAIATLHLALPYIDAEREPRLLWSQRFNLSVNLCRLGRYAEADRLQEEMQALARKVTKGVNRLRQTWLHGWIAAGMGRLEEAESALAAVRDEFLAREIGYDAALASLDLARLYLQQGRTAEVKTLAAQMVAVFQEQGVDRESLAAVHLFQEAAGREQASVELARRLADYLRRARHEAGLRFEE